MYKSDVANMHINYSNRMINAVYCVLFGNFVPSHGYKLPRKFLNHNHKNEFVHHSVMIIFVVLSNCLI